MTGIDFPGCPLCGGAGRAFARTATGSYGQCGTCRLVFRHPADLPDPASERAYYELHENDPADEGYRRFLGRLVTPMAERLVPGGRGLDYGCGPGPVLSVMFRELGFRVSDYDPMFRRDESLLEDSYDFICCTETVEHFHRPAVEFERLDDLLRPGAWLGVMTEPRDPSKEFTRWWYQRDPTHVCFYEPATLEWIARRFGWSLERPSRTVALFRKPAGSTQDHEAG